VGKKRLIGIRDYLAVPQNPVLSAIIGFINAITSHEIAVVNVESW
jgi:hypothetical protein